MIEIIKEIFIFKIEKKTVAFFIIIIMLIFGGFLLSQGSVMAPFILLYSKYIMFILGISCFYRNSAACLIKNGEIGNSSGGTI